LENRRFKVFFSPIEIAGQMGCFVSGLKRLGHDAIGFNTYRTYLNYNNDIVNADLGDVLIQYELAKPNYDIFHYFFNSSLYWDFTDVRELHAMGKKLVMHIWGNDARLQSLVKQSNPFLQDPCNPLSDEVMIDRLKTSSSLIKTAIIQDYELYDHVKDYFTNVYVLPLAFDVAGTTPSYPDISKPVPLIIHAPTQPTFKGTSYIECTLELLRNAGYLFEYRRIEKMSHEEAMNYYKQADIVIDQVSVGTHGTFAVEAMALGKPVVAYIREDLVSTFPPNLPIVNASPVTLYQQLIPLLTSPLLRHQTGVQSRQYVEERHDISKVIPQLLDIYDVVSQT
jgi:glycosyltransferase involved in cell wall biosynthesis